MQERERERERGRERERERDYQCACYNLYNFINVIMNWQFSIL